MIWNSIFISGWTIEKWNQIGKEDGWPWSQTDECRFVEGGKILRWRLKPPDFLAPAPQPRCTFSEDFSETFLRGALALMQSRNCPSCISYWSVINLQCIFIWLAKNQDYQKHLCVSNVCFELLRIAGIGAKDCQTLPVDIFQIFQRLSNINLQQGLPQVYWCWNRIVESKNRNMKYSRRSDSREWLWKNIRLWWKYEIRLW